MERGNVIEPRRHIVDTRITVDHGSPGINKKQYGRKMLKARGRRKKPLDDYYDDNKRKIDEEKCRE